MQPVLATKWLYIIMQMMFMMVISVVELAADNVSFDIHVLSHDFCTIIWLHTLFPTRKQKLSLKYWLVILHLSKAQKQGEVSLPILSAIPFTNVEFRDGMGLHEDGKWPSPLLLCFFERWSMTGHC